MSDRWKVVKVNGVCCACGGSGMKVLHHQGDPVEDVPQGERCRTVYAATTYVTCECRIIRSGEVGSPLIGGPR